MLERIKGYEFKGTTLQVEQKRYGSFNNRKNRFCIPFTGGVWIPTQQLSKVGSKATFGFQILYAFDKIKIYLDLNLRVGNTSQYIHVFKEDSLYNTNKQTGWNVGLGLNYEMIKMKQHSFEILSGVGYDGITFTLIDHENGDEDYSKDVGSININAGIGYRYNFKKEGFIQYLGLDSRYHVFTYRNKGGTNLSGNAITIGINVGINGSY